MLIFCEPARNFLVGRNEENELIVNIDKGILHYVSRKSTPEELRQIADKLDELNKIG